MWVPPLFHPHAAWKLVDAILVAACLSARQKQDQVCPNASNSRVELQLRHWWFRWATVQEVAEEMRPED